VIIGLIIGGVLVGVDMIQAAAIRAQITQIGQYNTAVHAFQAKYDALPGDMPNPAIYGFAARAGTSGRGDGNGVIEGYNYLSNTVTTDVQSGETMLAWADLSAARLIDKTFASTTDTWPGSGV